MRWSEFRFLNNIGEVARATVFPVDRAGTRRRFVLIYFVRLCFLVGRRLWNDHCPRHAAALSFQTFLSMVPLLGLALVVSTMMDLDQYQDRAMGFIRANLVPTAAHDVGDQVVRLVDAFRSKTFGIVNGTTLIAVALTLLFTVEGTINEIFGRPRKRRFIIRLLIAVTVLSLAPLAVGVSLFLTGQLVYLPQIVPAALPLLFTVIALFFCYWLLPHTKIKIRYSLVSAFIAGIMFELIKIGFAFYAKYLGETLSYVYGTFAIFPLFMVWVYSAWLIFLFGAEFNAALHEVARHDRFFSG